MPSIGNIGFNGVKILNKSEMVLHRMQSFSSKMSLQLDNLFDYIILYKYYIYIKIFHYLYTHTHTFIYMNNNVMLKQKLCI